MFSTERIVGWLLSAGLLAAVVWSVTGFISGPDESPRPRAEVATDYTSDYTIDGVTDSRVTPDRPSRAPASPEAVAGPFTLGDDSSLDGLWGACESGDGVSCDRLFEVSPVGSDYERFGLTCGDRPLVLNCSEELVEP